MFKNMLKRSWLSVSRKLSRTVIVALILFAMANLVLATIAIKGAVNESTDYAKESLGGIVYLQPDMEALHEKMMSGMQSSNTAEAGTTAAPNRIARPTVPVATAKAIAKSDYVKDFSYGLQTTANASNFTVLETTAPSSPMGGSGRQPDDAAGAEKTGITRGDTTIVSINSFAFIPEVEAGTVKLSDGKIFDETTADGVMISFELATANSLKVGDELKLKTTEDEAEKTLKIIGIYDVTDDNFNANTVYMNTDTAAKFMPASEYNDGAYGVQSVKYYLTNAEYKDQFIAEANKKYPTLADDGLSLSIDDSAYEQMVGPIENVGSFANTVLWIAIIASIVIITLIVTINVKDRHYEIGVLLSLGASKLNVLGQILIELVIVGTVAFAASIGTSTFLANAMGSSMLDKQITMNQEETTENFGRGLHAGHGGMVQQMRNEFGAGSSDVETIKEINISANATDYAILFGVGYLVIILSLIVPTANVLRYQPKTILTGRE